MLNMWLDKAFIHYVIVELAPGSLGGQIPALLLSHQQLPKKCSGTPFGDLLPLGCKKKGEDTIIWSMLNDPSFKKMFKIDYKVKIRWIKKGRMYVEQPEVMKKEIFRDIKNMPIKFKQLEPLCPQPLLKVSDDQTEKTAGVVSGSWEKRDEVSPTSEINLSDIFPDLRIRGLQASAGKRDFASWFTAIPPDVKVDRDFKCDKGILKKDLFCDSDMLDTYLGLGE